MTLGQLIETYKNRHILAKAAHPERAAYNIKRQLATYLAK